MSWVPGLGFQIPHFGSRVSAPGFHPIDGSQVSSPTKSPGSRVAFSDIPYSSIAIHYTVQLIKSVARVLTKFELPETNGTATYCEMITD